jgi:hypothetical protein
LIHDLFIALGDTSLSKEALLQSGALDYWISLAIKSADFDGQN